MRGGSFGLKLMNKVLILTGHPQLKPAVYREILVELDRIGAGIPVGRSHHIGTASTIGEGMLLVDEFDTIENFNAFREKWNAVLNKRGLGPSTFTIYHIVYKQHSATHALAYHR